MSTNENMIGVELTANVHALDSAIQQAIDQQIALTRVAAKGAIAVLNGVDAAEDSGLDRNNAVKAVAGAMKTFQAGAAAQLGAMRADNAAGLKSDKVDVRTKARARLELANEKLLTVTGMSAGQLSKLQNGVASLPQIGAQG